VFGVEAEVRADVADNTIRVDSTDQMEVVGVVLAGGARGDFRHGY